MGSRRKPDHPVKYLTASSSASRLSSAAGRRWPRRSSLRRLQVQELGRGFPSEAVRDREIVRGDSYGCGCQPGRPSLRGEVLLYQRPPALPAWLSAEEVSPMALRARVRSFGDEPIQAAMMSEPVKVGRSGLLCFGGWPPVGAVFEGLRGDNCFIASSIDRSAKSVVDDGFASTKRATACSARRCARRYHCASEMWSIHHEA